MVKLIAPLALVGVLIAGCSSGPEPTIVPSHQDGLTPELTSYCLPDGSGMRMYERVAAQGFPLISLAYTGSLGRSNPAYCPDMHRI